MSRQPPNFLLMTTDQHRADHLGCYGNSVLRTPHIDSLADRGTRYHRAYVASPVCMPNRASLVTGRMPSLHGLRHNGLDLKLGTVTMPEMLRRAGFHTSLSGKPHFQCVTRTPTVLNRPGGRQGRTEAHDPDEGRYDQEAGPLWRRDPRRQMQLPYYGFQTVDLAVGHGDQVDGHYNDWVTGKGYQLEALRGPENALSGSDEGVFQAWRTRVPEDAYPTRFVQERTVEALARYANEPKTPFFHWASFCDPHHPFTPPGRYWDMYRAEDVDLPRSFYCGGRFEPVAAVHNLRRRGEAHLQGTSAIAVSESELRAAIALTYGMISMVDEAVGAILDALTSFGLHDNTIVIFMSDHGDLMGDHGLIFKGLYHYQGLVRTPLIWVDPRDPVATVSDAPVSVIDVPTTILETAGIAPFNGMQGRAFRTGDGKALIARESILIEDEVQACLPGQHVRGRARTLISGRWRLTIYDAIGTGELVDLVGDPDEAHNRWDDPDAAKIRAEMTERLLREMIAHSETSPLPDFAA